MQIVRNFIFLFGIIMSFILVSCTEKSGDYPDLEGYWKEEAMINNATGESITCNRLYWAFQLSVAEIRDLGDNGYSKYISRFTYDESANIIRMYDFRNRGNQKVVTDASILQFFGITPKMMSDSTAYEATFNVLKLDGDNMVLQNDSLTLYFRSF